MPKLQTAVMHLTDDDEHVVSAARRSVRVRIRVWRRMGHPALVLVEPADGEGNIRPWAGRIAAHVEIEIFKGRVTASCYVEHWGAYDKEEWNLVTFAINRLKFHVHPDRQPIDRNALEFAVGGPV